jgi:hypothetical protein
VKYCDQKILIAVKKEGMIILFILFNNKYHGSKNYFHQGKDILRRAPYVFWVFLLSSELADYLHNKEHLRRGNQSQIETRSLLSRYEQQTGKHVEDMLRDPVIFYTYVDRDRYEPHQVLLFCLFLFFVGSVFSSSCFISVLFFGLSHR